MLTWSDPTSDEEAQRRAGGRRLYNGTRQVLAELRRLRLIRTVRRLDLMLCGRGTQARLARLLRVSPSTVCRDMKRILAALHERDRA